MHRYIHIIFSHVLLVGLVFTFVLLFWPVFICICVNLLPSAFTCVHVPTYVCSPAYIHSYLVVMPSLHMHIHIGDLSLVLPCTRETGVN